MMAPRKSQLIEADLNMCLSKLFRRRLMDNAEKHNLLHPHQFGSRKGRKSISAVLLLNEYLTTTSARPEWMQSSLTVMHVHVMTE
jgi:hypothetical protein